MSRFWARLLDPQESGLPEFKSEKRLKIFLAALAYREVLLFARYERRRRGKALPEETLTDAHSGADQAVVDALDFLAVLRTLLTPTERQYLDLVLIAAHADTNNGPFSYAHCRKLLQHIRAKARGLEGDAAQ